MPRNSKRSFSPQVDDPNYLTMSYLSRERWISFWYQLMEVTETKPESVLEIGPGPGIVIRAIRDFGVFGVTADVDFRLRPTVGTDITKLPFVDKAFDCVLAAEVLEHIPFAEVPKALTEISRVCRKSMVITLPHFSQFSPSFALKFFPYVPRLQKAFPISIFPPKHRFDGQHYWEIGKRGYPISRIRNLLAENTGFRLIKDYLIEENPFHHMFVLKKNQ
ncbi:methyltransferase domain-containing protein [Candidatus Collierbacteria bacterium]|nr:methyltransferase domain-containing protein [Candidatus Collierbacteria bacterium]